ncbi:MAG: S8 family serine peptidase [Candidatus Dadabacteria bacterium]|nr:S8 family serine peptidase [Candidatus Dadabacteria bacterium]MYE61634.1 S8 family serine peptidase [Candidatus Dadabacteria bacterium]MYI72949.1 S8 family serine peptidase [Candidatus Dadabacteria bacterium]
MIAKNFKWLTKEGEPGEYGLCGRCWHRLRAGTFRASGFFSRLNFTFRAAGLSLLACAVLLSAGGCGGGTEEGMPPFTEDPPPVGPASPARPNPVELEFRETHLGSPDMPDGEDYKDDEFMAHWGLTAIDADEAYGRGYFGQGVTIAVADDGMDLAHPDLALDGKIKAPWHIRNRNNMVSEAYREGVHGTYVAMIAAGARGNTDGNFEITVDDGARIPTRNIHGVAPRASVMPIAMSGGATPVEAVRYAVRNKAHMLNLSIGISTFYYGKYTGREGVWLTQPLPFFRPLLSLDLIQEFAEVAGVIENQDIVLVWAAGNEGWNSYRRDAVVSMCGKNFIDEDGCLLGEMHVSQQEFMENFMWIYDENNPDDTISFKGMWGEDCGEDNCAEYNSSGEWREAPLFEPGLLGKWIVAAASDRNGTISSFSNGCGAARNWCLVAPGEGLTINPGDSHGLSGTSFAAPMVSGALAVLKSRFPDMPMDVIQAILLVSADPVGIREDNHEEPDPVYGWGRLDLRSAVIKQDAVRLPYSVPGTAGATRAISPGHYRPPLLPASVQTHTGSQNRGLRQGQCVSPYEIIRRYQNRNGRPRQMIDRSGI